MDQTPAQRTFVRRIGPAAWAYSAFLLAGYYLIDLARTVPGLPWVIALVAALPAAAFIWILAAYLRDETDEYVRLQEARKCLVATGILLTVATFYGFLELFELVPHAPIFLVGPVWFLGLAVGSVYNRMAA